MKKIAKIEKYLDILEKNKKDCKDKILIDEIYQAAILHYLYLMSDSCVNLAQMVIKYKNLEIPQSYYEAIDILGEKGILPKEFAYNFAKIASFRNFLAHDYEKIDYLYICEVMFDKLKEVKEYLSYIKNI